MTNAIMYIVSDAMYEKLANNLSPPFSPEVWLFAFIFVATSSFEILLFVNIFPANRGRINTKNKISLLCKNQLTISQLFNCISNALLGIFENRPQ